MHKTMLVIAACAVAGAALCHAETDAARLQELYKERVELFFTTDKLNRQVSEAMYNTAITSDAIVEARKAQTEKRFALEMAQAEILTLEREGKAVPDEKKSALQKAEAAYAGAAAALEKAVGEHPQVKALKAELDKANARAEELREAYEAIMKKRQAAG